MSDIEVEMQEVEVVTVQMDEVAEPQTAISQMFGMIEQTIVQAIAGIANLKQKLADTMTAPAVAPAEVEALQAEINSLKATIAAYNQAEAIEDADTEAKVASLAKLAETLKSALS